MKVQIVGAGIVGEATARLAQHLKHEVHGFDIKERSSPYYSTGLIYDPAIVFICVNETAVEDAIENLIGRRVGGTYVVRSSTKPGTIDRLATQYGKHICHNPEFLREATYLEDAINPAFIVLGACCPEHSLLLENFYIPISWRVKFVKTFPVYSEMMKLTVNNYLATLVSFWCEVYRIANAIKIDPYELARIVKMDPRVSQYGFSPMGKGFSGKCLPKDLRQMIDFCQENNTEPLFFEFLEEYNGASILK